MEKQKTIKTALTNFLTEIDFPLDRVSGISDGANVMVGSKTGLVARLQEVDRWWSTINTHKCFTIYFSREDGTMEPTINTIIGPAVHILFTHNNNINTCTFNV